MSSYTSYTYTRTYIHTSPYSVHIQVFIIYFYYIINEDDVCLFFFYFKTLF